MNPEELEIAKAVTEGAVEGATKSLQTIVQNLLGPWSAEVGEDWADARRQRRRERAAARVAERALAILEASGVARRAIPPKVLFAALEYASLETEADLQERWASLIATAASDAAAVDVSRDFVEVLKELTARDAQLIEWIADRPPELDPNIPNMQKSQFSPPPAEYVRPRAARATIVDHFGLPDAEFELVCSRLERLGLCDVGRFVFPTRVGSSGTGPRRYDSIQLRPFGVALVNACRVHIQP